MIASCLSIKVQSNDKFNMINVYDKCIVQYDKFVYINGKS